jgi:integrase
VKQQRASYQCGSISLDRRRQIWYFRWREDGIRRSTRLGPLSEIRNKAAAKRKAEGEVSRIRSEQLKHEPVTVNAVVQRYLEEKLPKRFSTRAAYQYNLNNHVIPRWGKVAITDLKPYPVELWLKSLQLAPKTKVHIRGLLRLIIENAMLWEYLPIIRNPMELVNIQGATKRTEEPTNLTVEQFHSLLAQIDREPYRSMVLTAMCIGPRFSELIALQWQDIDWGNLRVLIRRSAVRNRVDDVKTRYSAKPLPIDPDLAEILLAWRRQSQFVADSDWVWASPAMAGEKPYFYTTLLKVVQDAATKAGLDGVGWHTFRHSYRSWLDETGAPIGVQQKLMRHSDIRTTMNIYGDAIPETMREVHGKVVKMALRA